MSRVVKVLGAAVLAGSTALAAGAPASADILPVHLLGHADLALSIRDGAGAHGPVLKKVYLTCRPSGGSHPHPAKACRALAHVDGRFEKLRGKPGICTLIYHPVTAVAYGHWGTRTVRYVQTYDNTCRLKNALAPVYDF